MGRAGFLAMAGVSVESGNTAALHHAASAPALAGSPAPAPAPAAALPAGPANALTPSWADPALSQVCAPV